MSDFEAFSDEIEEGMAYLEHHGILGQKWGKLNGPPYPLGSGDHSASERNAAAAAGVKVGKDSGKGSIANVKKSGAVSKSTRKVMTEEEKREEALKAVKSGDKKKIAKYIDQLSTQELFDAENRARVKSNLTREEPGEKKASKADMEKMEVIRSGDKAKVREYADKMSYQELSEAMNRIDLNAKLYYEKPAPTALDKFTDAMDKVGRIRNAAEKGIAAYNTIAKVYNSTHKDGPLWPEIQAGLSNKTKEAKKSQDVLDKLVDRASKDVSKGVKETRERKEQEEAKAAAKEAKAAAKAEKKAQKALEKEQKKYTVEKAPKLKDKQQEEPTEEQKELVERARVSDNNYLSRINSVSNQKMSDYDDFDYSSIFSESYMQSQRDTSFSRAMESFDYDDWRDSVRWSDF